MLHGVQLVIFTFCLSSGSSVLHLDITSRSFIKFSCNEVMHFWSTHLSPAIHPIKILAVFQLLFIVCVILILPTSQCLYCREDLLIHQEQNLCFCPANFHCEKLNIIASVSYMFIAWCCESRNLIRVLYVKFNVLGKITMKRKLVYRL